MKGQEIWQKINQNKQLKRLELLGFTRGEKKGKTIDVSIGTIYCAVEKQMADLRSAYLLCEDKAKVRRCIADLRNVAGCLFLKFEEAKP